MTRQFQEGDRVTVVFTNNILPGHLCEYSAGSLTIDAYIEHVPAATGDCFHFRSFAYGVIFMVNPNCSEFVGLQRL